MYIKQLASKEDTADLEKFLDLLEKIVDNEDKRNRLFVFLGAGFSAKFNLPNWNSLVENIINDIMYSDNVQYSPDKNEIRFYLIKTLHSDMNIKLKISLINQLILDKFSSNRLLYDSLKKNIRLNDSVREYSKVTEEELDILKRLGKINAVFCTTNFDNILKEVLDIENQIVKTPEYIDYGRKGIIHLHGALAKTNEVDFLEDLVFDFQSYLKKYNQPGKSESLLTEIMEADKLQNSTILFLGSSMQEPELVGLVSNDKKFNNKYALLGFDTEYEYKIASQFYSKHNIEIIGYNSSIDNNLFSEIILKISLRLVVKSPGSALDELITSFEKGE